MSEKPSDNVVRHSPSHGYDSAGNAVHYMARDAKGDYVLFTDFANLKADSDWHFKNWQDVAKRAEAAERDRSDLRVGIDGMHARIQALEAEVAHWKANHDEMVRRNATLRDRPDLGDRSQRMAQMQQAIDLLGETLRYHRARDKAMSLTEDRRIRLALDIAALAVDANPISAAAVRGKGGGE